MLTWQISAGELGTTVKKLETQLPLIFQRANKWNAVLLLDEADVFLEQRSVHDCRPRIPMPLHQSRAWSLPRTPVERKDVMANGVGQRHGLLTMGSTHCTRVYDKCLHLGLKSSSLPPPHHGSFGGCHPESNKVHEQIRRIFLPYLPLPTLCLIFQAGKRIMDYLSCPLVTSTGSQSMARSNLEAPII